MPITVEKAIKSDKIASMTVTGKRVKPLPGWLKWGLIAAGAIVIWKVFKKNDIQGADIKSTSIGQS
jgi:hypothetical protein